MDITTKEYVPISVPDKSVYDGKRINVFPLQTYFYVAQGYAINPFEIRRNVYNTTPEMYRVYNTVTRKSNLHGEPAVTAWVGGQNDAILRCARLDTGEQFSVDILGNGWDDIDDPYNLRKLWVHVLPGYTYIRYPATIISDSGLKIALTIKTRQSGSQPLPLPLIRFPAIGNHKRTGLPNPPTDVRSKKPFGEINTNCHVVGSFTVEYKTEEIRPSGTTTNTFREDVWCGLNPADPSRFIHTPTQLTFFDDIMGFASQAEYQNALGLLASRAVPEGVFFENLPEETEETV